MRSDLEIKIMLSKALQSVVRRAFLKRNFNDDFSDEEMEKVKEIDEFLRAVSLHKDNPMFDDTQIKYFCVSVRSTYIRKNGNEVSVFVNKFINQKDFEYKKIDYYVAKCIYRLSQNRHIEMFFAVNTFKAKLINDKFYVPERTRECIKSSCAVYTDIDLPSKLIHLSNEEILSLLKTDYEELWLNLKPTYIVRSGGGVHIYFCLEESFYLKTDEQEFFYIDMLRTLQMIFEAYGADCRCVDMTRILRVPNSKNRKPKYGSDGKDVSVIYKSDNSYDVFELDKKLKFLLSGGMEGVCQSVLDDMFSDEAEPKREEVIIEEADTDILEVTAETLEDKPKKRKVTATVKRLVDFCYKGIQPFYDFNGETYFQAKDIMCWIQNREQHEGVRNDILFCMNYIWFVYNHVWDYETMLERSKRLNTYFKPNLSYTELLKAVRNNFNNLNSRKHYNRSIRNTTLQSYLHFTEEEKRYCCRGIYCDTYSEYQKALRLKKMKYSKDRYTKQLKEEGLIRRTEQKAINKKLLEDNPLMSFEEFNKRTGLSKASYDVYKREIGNTKEKHFKQQRDYYLQPFIDNKNITCNEYMEMLNCSSSTFRKYRKIFRDLYI